MAVLGVGGRVLLKRPTPAPCTVYGERYINVGTERCPDYFLIDDYNTDCNAFKISCANWQNGDRISAEGLPLYGKTNQPYNPDGYASYAGSRYWLGPNRDHISGESDFFYKRSSAYSYGPGAADWACEPGTGDYGNADVEDEDTDESICEFSPTFDQPVAGTDDYGNADIKDRLDGTADGDAPPQVIDNDECYDETRCGDEAWFYAQEGKGDVPIGNGSGDFYIHIDQFGYVRFYSSRCSAIGGCPEKAIDLAPIWVGEGITLYPYGQADYQNAEWECIYDTCLIGGDYGNSDVQDNLSDVSICADAPEFVKPEAGFKEYANADVLPRPYSEFNNAQILCDLREYSLTLDAPAVDTTIVGEKYGEAVKSLVNGGGSFEFFVDRTCLDDRAEDASWELFNLLFLTEGGGTQQPITAEAWFYLMSGNGCAPCFPPAAGKLYYKADILITQTAVNVRPTEMIVGTAQFVTTGEIKLLQAP